MQFEGKNVSERIKVNAVVLSVNESKKNPGRYFINFATHDGEHGARLYPDVDATPFKGHACVLGLRLIGPEFARSNYDRQWVCDSIEEVSPF